jgi:hypothetical protein
MTRVVTQKAKSATAIAQNFQSSESQAFLVAVSKFTEKLIVSL